MRRFLISLSLVLLAVAAPQRVFSQNADTSELFLNAYMANEQGEQLEGADPHKALSKFKYAASLLDQIGRNDPNWQPIVVNYRKKKVSENIARLEGQIGNEPAPAETPAASAEQPMEGELPQKDNTPPSPDFTGTQQPTLEPTPAQAGPGTSQQVRDQLSELQSELKESRARLKTVEGEKADLAGRLGDALKQIDGVKVSETELKGQLKQAQDAYQNAVADHDRISGAPKDIQVRITQLENALKDAEADRDAANEQGAEDARRAAKARAASEEALKAQLKQAQDAYKASLTGHSQSTATQKQLQARVAQLEEALKTAEADRDAADEQEAEETRRAAKARQDAAALAQQLDAAHTQTKAIETKYADASKVAAQLDAANAQIATLTKDRDDATQKADDLDKKLAASSKTEAKLAAAQKEITTLKASQEQATGKNSDLASKLAAAQKQVDQITSDRDDAQQQITDLNAKLADAQKQVITSKAARKQIQQLTDDRDTAREQVAALTGKLADATKEIASVKTDRDQIAAQRDQALADLGKARDAQKRVDQLLADNATLTQKLAADEKTIKGFKSDSPEKDKQIADLRKEVGDTQALLTKAQQERDTVQSTLNDLQQQYDSTSNQLAELKANTGVNNTEKQTLTDENDLLRGIVLRQLKEQARRDQTKRLVMTELSQLQVQSDTLLKNIDFLGQPVVHLTDKEKALFKDPELEIPDADDTTMAISIAAPKQNPAASPAASAPTPAPAPESSPAPAAAVSPSPSADVAPSPAGAVTSVSSPTPTPMQLASLTKAGSPGSGTSNSPGQPANASKGTATAGPMVPPELMDDARAAKEAFDRTEYLDAEKLYEKMLAKAPNNVYILSNLGVVYFRNQKWKLAEEALQKAVAVAPADTFSHCTLGIVYYQEKRYDDAINSLTRALAINPKYAVAHNYLGITASQKGWQEAAKKELETAVEIDPNYADAYFNLAVVYAMEQPPDKQLAGKYYKRATELGAEPDSGLEQLVK